MAERGSQVRHNVYPLCRVRRIPSGLCRMIDCGGNENCRKKCFSASPRVQVRKSVIYDEKKSGDFPIRSSSLPIMIPTMKYVELEDIDPKIGRKLRRQSNREKGDEEIIHEDNLRPEEPLFTMKL